MCCVLWEVGSGALSFFGYWKVADAVSESDWGLKQFAEAQLKQVHVPSIFVKIGL